MKGTLKSFKKVLRESFEEKLEDLDRERRASAGNYDNEDEGSGVTYGDRYGEAVELEDVDRVRRHEDGYGDDLEEAGEDPFKALGATGAQQLTRGTAAAAAKTDPKMVAQAAVDAVMKILGDKPSSTKNMALTQLKQQLGPAGAAKMPSMESLTSEMEAPSDEDEKKKSVARPSSLFNGDDQSTMDAMPQLSGYDPLSDDDPKDRLSEKTPPGKEDMVKALKKDSDVDNPWAVAWAAHNKAKDRRK